MICSSRLFRSWSGLVRGLAITAAFSPTVAVAQDATPGRRIADVAFPAAGMVEPAPPHPASVAQVIATVRLPVLIPARFARARSFEVVTAGPYDYTASILLSGAKLWINGSRQEVVLPEGAAAAMENEPAPGAFTEPDPPEPRLVNRRFKRYGAGYVISAECARPSDTRCDDAYLATLERSVRVFGGAQ